jgi:hypothetical protein
MLGDLLTCIAYSCVIEDRYSEKAENSSDAAADNRRAAPWVPHSGEFHVAAGLIGLDFDHVCWNLNVHDIAFRFRDYGFNS